VVLGNDGLSLSGPRYAASHPGTLSEGADAVLGRDGLYGEAPASAEKYSDVLKERPGDIRTAADAGVRFLGEPYRYPWGLAAILLDQDGSPVLLQEESGEQ
jgi:hypothetical protein